MTEPLFSNPPAEVTSPKPARQVFASEFTHFADDDIHARADELRDIVDRSLIVPDPPDPSWQPDPKDIA